MFWYSIKTHKPSDSGQYLVFQENTGYCLVVDVEHYNDGTFKFVNDKPCDYVEGITHFASIPPIPLPVDSAIHNLKIIKIAPCALPKMEEVYILDLDLPERAKRCLIAENINTLKDLSQYTISQLCVIPNLGRLTLQRIKEELKKYRIRLNER